MRHFLDIRDITRDDMITILTEAARRKRQRSSGDLRPLEGKMLAMIFEKPSTRTRVSFEVAMRELGGVATALQKDEIQLGRGETIADTSRTLSRYVHAMMLRAYHHQTLLDLAQHSIVPVINGLTDLLHPCQLMADILTIEERFGRISGKKVAWVGDGNNMANTWITVAMKFDFELVLACPKSRMPDKKILAAAQKKRGTKITVTTKPAEAVEKADIVYTDSWFSMGEAPTRAGKQLFKGFRVDDKLMAQAKRSAAFFHCLPAHRGEEVTDAVIDGKKSAVWDQAENRLHVQKAILLWCLGEI